jgi:hypothetical protein
MVPPVGAGQIRVALKDDMVLCNSFLKLPRGTMVWVPHHAIQNCEHNWDEPTKFMPGMYFIILSQKNKRCEVTLHLGANWCRTLSQQVA